MTDLAIRDRDQPAVFGLTLTRSAPDEQPGYWVLSVSESQPGRFTYAINVVVTLADGDRLAAALAGAGA